ncbi:MAG: S9 family peptidase, partial [Candidatus Heimdallarchaeota archaeon]
MKYPATKREEVVEVLHGKTITDQYRWLENFDAPEVQEWLEEQHEYLDATLSQIPNYKKSTKRILDLLSMGVLTAPRYKKGLLFYQKSTIENQPILFVQKGFDGEPKVLLDPNLLAKEN